ncbi:MAG: type I restriction enzyme HsdR N-terminal domain-containing protein [Caldilineaceae bacterium]|nr:type I restriction enzyme HsdR N-terminal domain-containing protein [Caldilineaceae bacterium]
MDFIDRIRELGARIPKQLELIQTEEATKHALVMPFISALGYDVFDPTEVVPELNADVGTKKGEKVDYAIRKDNQIIMLFECKAANCDLGSAHASQLYRYFSVTEARFSVLTNGIVYWFYSDLDAQNKMDSKPFFEFNMLDIREQDVEELKKFTKPAFDLDGILTTASELKYTREIKRILAEQLQDPSEDFVRLFGVQVYQGRMTQSVKEQFTEMTRRAFRQFINDRVQERLKSALASESTPVEQMPAETDEGNTDTNGKVVTTPEEWEAYYIIKAICSQVVEPERVAIRDQQTYCGILFDDNNRRPLARLWFNTSQKYIGLFDGEERQEQKTPIAKISDIYQFADRLKATATNYLS